MNQDDFRALLSSSRASDQSTSRYASLGSSSGGRRPGHEQRGTSALGMAPRKQNKGKAPSKSNTEESSSRAAPSGGRLGAEPTNRLGVDKMLDILRETNPDMTEDQLRQLAGEGGGPRGLDLSFIEQAKKQEADRNTSKAESALDDLLDEAAAAPPSQPAESKKTQEDTEPPKKRSRDEILRSLREGGSVPATEKPSKFRKVGSDKAKTAEADQASQKQPKKVKKKVKKVVKKEPAVEEKKKEDSVDATQPKHVEAVPPVSHHSPPPQKQEKDDDMDIFAGADYSGLSDSSGSDSDEERPKKPAAARRPASDGEEDTELAAEKKSKSTWFDDGENEEADAIKAPSIPRPPPPSKPREDANSGDEDAQAARSEIRAMLDADKAAERDEKRKERKQRWREKQGLGNREGGVELEGASKPSKEKKLTEKDKLNRDYQQLQSRLNKPKE